MYASIPHVIELLQKFSADSNYDWRISCFTVYIIFVTIPQNPSQLQLTDSCEQFAIDFKLCLFSML